MQGLFELVVLEDTTVRPHCGKIKQQEALVPHLETDEYSHSANFLHFLQYRTLAHGIVPHTDEGGLPPSVNFIGQSLKDIPRGYLR